MVKLLVDAGAYLNAMDKVSACGVCVCVCEREREREREREKYVVIKLIEVNSQ